MSDRTRRFSFLRWLGLRSREEVQAAAETRRLDPEAADRMTAEAMRVSGDVTDSDDTVITDDLRAHMASTVDDGKTPAPTEDEGLPEAEIQRKATEASRSIEETEDAARLKVQAEVESARAAEEAEDTAIETHQKLLDTAQEARNQALDEAKAAAEGAGKDAPEEPLDKEEAAAEAQAKADEAEQQTLEMREEMLQRISDEPADEPVVAAQSADATKSMATEEAVRSIEDREERLAAAATGEFDRSVDNLEELLATATTEDIDRATLAEAAADPGGDDRDFDGQSGIEEPLSGADVVAETGGDEGAIGLEAGFGRADAGDITDPAGLLGGAITGIPGKAEFDADAGFAQADPRLAADAGDFSGTQLWEDYTSSDGTQNIYGQEHYDDDRYSTDVITTHEDGTTSQEVTRTDKLTGEVLTERTTDEDAAVDPDWPVGGNKYDTFEDAYNATHGGGDDTGGGDTSGGDTEGSGATGGGADSTGGDASGSDDSGGGDTSDDDEETTIVPGTDSTPDPEGTDGLRAPATEAFREFTDQYAVRTSAPDILGADSLQQPPEGEMGIREYERPPREVDEAVMRERLDPYIQHTEDYVEVPRLSPEDLVFENTLVDPEPDITLGGLEGLKDGPGPGGTDPVADDGMDDVDLEP